MGLVVYSPIDIGRRGCYACDEIGHVAKKFSQCEFRVTLFSSVRGRGSTKGARGRDGRGCGGGCGATQQLVVVDSVMLYQPNLRKRLLVL